MSGREVYRGEIDDEGPEMDLDRYDSAMRRSDVKQSEQMLAEARKRNPRFFEPPPEMMFYRSVTEWIEAAVQGPPPGQLFGPFWLEEELSEKAFGRHRLPKPGPAVRGSPRLTGPPHPGPGLSGCSI